MWSGSILPAAAAAVRVCEEGGRRGFGGGGDGRWGGRKTDEAQSRWVKVVPRNQRILRGVGSGGHRGPDTGVGSGAMG